LNPVATNSNLARLAEAAYERRGDYASLLFEGHWHRSGDLFERSRRIAGGLAELGIAPGERVVVSMVNRPEVSVAYQALWRAGAVVTRPRSCCHSRYGLTETAALISTNPGGGERPGSVGLPVPGATVKIVDDDGHELPAGEAGEICGRSPRLCAATGTGAGGIQI
jgi:acyl-CoA synthetase (AMP-forming)/AMP-acid ligase II